MPKSVSGRIEDFGIVELVQTLYLGQKTARIDLAQEAVSGGLLVFFGGRLVHAATPALVGEEAFFEIGSWTHGTFAITSGNGIPADRTIAKSNDWLVLELLRRRDRAG